MTCIFNVNFENNQLILYCFKDFNTFRIKLSEISQFNYNNFLNNNLINENRYLIKNLNNQNILMEYLDCDIQMNEVFGNNYNICSFNDYNYNNYQYLDIIVWMNILGRINL